jgi:hypothetical protein
MVHRFHGSGHRVMAVPLRKMCGSGAPDRRPISVGLKRFSMALKLKYIHSIFSHFLVRYADQQVADGGALTIVEVLLSQGIK